MKKLSLLWGIALTLLLSFSSVHAEDFWQDTLWIRKLPFGGNVYAKVMFHPDGKSIFAASDQYLFRYDVQTGIVLDTKVMRSRGNVRDYILMKDNRTMIIACDSQHKVSYDYTRYIEIWDIDTGYIRHHKYEQFFEIQRTSALRLSHDEKTIYVGSDVTGGELNEIEYSTGKFLKKRNGVGHYIDISSDGKYMVSSYIGDNNGICKLIDMEKWETLAQLSRVYEPKFSPDGRFFAGRNESENILFYDIENKKGYILKGHSGRISDMCFTNDNKYLVSSADDGGAKGGYKIWDLSSKKYVFEAPVSTGTSGYLSLSPDNSLYAIVGKGDGIFVLLWKFKGIINSLPQNEENTNTISIIPNPSSNTVTIQFPSMKENASLIMRDMAGKEIYKKYLTEADRINGSIIIPISNFPNGTYICTIIVNNLPFLTTSFIINR